MNMNAIEKRAKNALQFTAAVAGAVVVVALAPLVSLVALPIFAAKAAWHWREHASLYSQTLNHKGAREQFGRVEGQDYTRWDGKATSLAQINLNNIEKRHEALGLYVHGAKTTPRQNYFSKEDVPASPFTTEEDLRWLNREFARKEKQDLLDSDLRIVRAIAKGLIPLIGVIWILATELDFGGASEMGCRVCMMGGDEDTHWSWRDALVFHKGNLQAKLANS